jgi:hypothetical protein
MLVPAETLAAGSDGLAVTYTPDAGGAAIYNASAGAAANPVIVAKVTPSIALTASQNPALASQSITFTAKVSATGGVPTGAVLFLDGSTQIGAGTLAAGTATCTTTTLPAGQHSITAEYAGDLNFTSIASSAVAETVAPFLLGPAQGAPTTVSIAPGAIGTFLLSVTPPASGSVSFSVTGLPSTFNVSFSPSAVPAGAGATFVEMIINIPAQSASAATPAKPGSAGRLPIALGLLLLPFMGVRRLRARRFFMLAVLAVAGLSSAIALTGCSHNFNLNGNANNHPTSPGTYQLTVTGTSGTQTESTNLTLIVE